MSDHEAKRRKVSAWTDDGNFTAHTFGNVFEHDQSGESARIILGLDSGWVDFMLDAVRQRTKVMMLFNQVLPRDPGRAGKYTSDLSTKAEATEVLERFRDLIERDARHEFWLSWPDEGDQAVLDNHNRLFLYGRQDVWRHQCEQFRVVEGPVILADPHAHFYHAEYDEDVAELLERYAWTFYPALDDD